MNQLEDHMGGLGPAHHKNGDGHQAIAILELL
jgi:hypothetical protein